jgi:ubiquinone/menaquinone biosynthesis C-methylase UbiE
MIYPKNYGEIYSQLNIEGTGYLAFRDIPLLVNQYVSGKATLDFGCGAGRSTRFLKFLNLNVEGIDINQEMINCAKILDPDINFTLVNKATINKGNEIYDFVFSSFVFFEFPTIEKIINSFKEIYRVLNYNGIFIFIAGSEYLYQKDWLTIDNNYSQNKNPASGSLVKIKLNLIDLELEDYYWTDADYKIAAKNTFFDLVGKVQPLGKPSDPYQWRSELTFPPYSIYILQKNLEH